MGRKLWRLLRRYFSSRQSRQSDCVDAIGSKSKTNLSQQHLVAFALLTAGSLVSRASPERGTVAIISNPAYRDFI
ncbi:hypothetical protein Z946_3994 [Sulfitobacter noctilucicola]|nr:hypothetical protein Z946_3994 [Sulfitobacter noctilucicola]